MPGLCRMQQSVGLYSSRAQVLIQQQGAGSFFLTKYMADNRIKRVISEVKIMKIFNTQTRKKEEFVPYFVDLDEAIRVNEEYVKENSYDSMIERELRVMKMLADIQET